mgnify:CR=1 FL=1
MLLVIWKKYTFFLIYTYQCASVPLTLSIVELRLLFLEPLLPLVEPIQRCLL